jgi:hypothetical protein
VFIVKVKFIKFENMLTITVQPALATTSIKQ